MKSYLSKINSLLIFISFFSLFFLWSFKLVEINQFYNFKYLIIYPIFVSLFSIIVLKKYDYVIKYKLFFFFFLIHYFLVNLVNDTKIHLNELTQIIFVIFLFISFVYYKNFIKKNFLYFLYFFQIILILSSLLIPSKINYGSCSYDMQLFLKAIGLQFSQGIFQERSHLAMVNVGVLISSIFYFTKYKNYKLLFFTSLTFLISIFNSSTTFVFGYFLCSIIFIIIIQNNLFRLLLLISSLLLLLLFNNYNCSKKITDININKIINNDLGNRKNLTSSVYERSFILTKKTFLKKPWGWGYDGSQKAVSHLYNKNLTKAQHNSTTDNATFHMNKKDLLGNLFKISTEFGVFIFGIFYIFIYYILRNKYFNEYQIFLISIFVVQLFRGAGYINSGFILAIFEFFIFFQTFKKNKQIN